MKRRRIDSVLLGGALALSGAVHRRVAEMDRRVDELTDDIAEVRATPAPAPAPAIPGMPLPTGYGLQVRGPQGESIVLPVCLPPGFELDSMMLSPEFLPRAEASAPAVPRAPAAIPGVAPSFAGASARTAAPAHPAAVALPHAAPPARPARPERRASAGRLDGVLQLVFGTDQGYSSSIEHSEDSLSSEPARGSPVVPESARL
jgi:hypothetical protein